MGAMLGSPCLGGQVDDEEREFVSRFPQLAWRYGGQRRCRVSTLFSLQTTDTDVENF